MDELSDKEQLEQIRAWWRENGWYVFGGIGLGILLLVGWNQYGAWQERRLADSAALYQGLYDAALQDNIGDAESLLTQLRDDYARSAYADQGGLLMARMYFRLGDPRRAAGELRHVMDSTRDREMSLIARLRLARVLVYLEEYNEALTLARVGEPGHMAARFSELRGDIHTALGEYDAARGAYMQALVEPGAELLDRTLLQLKLNDLPAAVESNS
jgi:predicted negative regulator of RcsB-dependent stress response